MEKHRNEFLTLLKERQFLPMALVRGRGQVEGYINSKVGFGENCWIQTRRVQEMASIISNDANNGAAGDRQQTL